MEEEEEEDYDQDEERGPLVTSGSPSDSESPQGSFLREHDLDRFFRHIYDYFAQKGLGCIIASALANIM
jgi:hypothetical protein